MPIYTFECDKCKERVEKVVPIGTPSVKCTCGARAKKAWSVPADPKIQGGTPKFYRGRR